MPDGQARPATMHEAAWDWLLTCPLSLIHI